METFLIYLLKSSGIIALFLLFYILFLKRETFFRANRIYLLVGMGFAIIIPFLVFTKIVWLQPMPMYQIQIPDQLGVAPATENSIDWTSLILYSYCAGVLLFAIRFVLQLISLKRLMRSGKKVRDEKFIRIETDQKSSPFSFFDYLVYNPALHTPSELNTILSHEKIHADERHSLDMLAMQLFTIFQWYNPFVWWYRACLNNNLEYTADTQTVAQNTTKIDYQYLLLRTGIGEKHYPMTAPFFSNSIKKRIIMLNKNRSNRKNSFKYALMLPLLAGFIFLFNVRTEAQVKPNPTSTNTESPKPDNIHDPSANENDYNPITYDKEHNGDFPRYSVKSNDNEEANEIFTITKNKLPQFYISDHLPLYFINGKEAFKNEVDDLDPNSIESMTVWKGQQAIDRYGENGKNGVVEIVLKKDYLNLPKTKYDDSLKIRGSNVSTKGNELGLDIDPTNLLYIMDGKEISKNEFEKIDPNWIKSVYIWKGKSAIARFWDKGKNGVVEIIMKKDYLNIPRTKETDDPKVRRSAIIVQDPIDEETYAAARADAKASGRMLSHQDKNPLILLDGKEVPYSTIDSLQQESIETVSVWKREQAIEKYGDKAKNGVIEIVTKKK